MFLVLVVLASPTWSKIELDKVPAISKAIEIKSPEGLVNASISQKFVEEKPKPKEEKQQSLNMLLSSNDADSNNQSFFSFPETRELRKQREAEKAKQEKEEEMLVTYGQPVPDRKTILGKKKAKKNELDQYIPKVDSLKEIFKDRKRWPELKANSNNARKLKRYAFPGLPYNPETDEITLPPLPPLGAQPLIVKGYALKNKAKLYAWLLKLGLNKANRVKKITDDFYNKFVETRSAAQKEYQEKIELAINDFHDRSSNKIKEELENHEEQLKRLEKEKAKSIQAGVRWGVKKLISDMEAQYKTIRLRQVAKIKKSAKKMFKKMYKEYLAYLDLKHEYYNTESIHVRDSYNEREFHMGNFDDGDV